MTLNKIDSAIGNWWLVQMESVDWIFRLKDSWSIWILELSYQKNQLLIDMKLCFDRSPTFFIWLESRILAMPVICSSPWSFKRKNAPMLKNVYLLCVRVMYQSCKPRLCIEKSVRCMSWWWNPIYRYVGQLISSVILPKGVTPPSLHPPPSFLLSRTCSLCCLLAANRTSWSTLALLAR